MVFDSHAQRDRNRRFGIAARGLRVGALRAGECAGDSARHLDLRPRARAGARRSLIAQFGEPELDVREGEGRKLQFAGPICVLDAYLYSKGHREPVVTYVDARQPDGRDIDRASCVAALIAARRR